MAIIDVVKWDAPRGIYAWKFPSEELSAKTQLIVSESQEAVMLKEGEMIGPFGPGRHTLSSDNYPILTSLLKKTITGKTPFSAEVWFIQKSIKLNIKWGTRSPLQVEDPQYHIILPIRAYGQYGIQIEDSAKFLFKLVGTLSCFHEDELADYFRGVVLSNAKDQIAKYVVEKNISILRISTSLKDLSSTIEKSLCSVVSEYGVRIINFNIEALTTKDDDPAVKKLRDALSERAEMDILGYNYQQKRSFDTMQIAAGNDGNGGIINAGIGMGLGMGLGVPAGNAMANMGVLLQAENQVKCTNCGKIISGDNQFCPSCGKEMQMRQNIMICCDKCGTRLSPDAIFCPKCGDKINRCPSCGTDNPEGSIKCIKCGQSMPINCPACGEKNPIGVKFCCKCGKNIIPSCPKCNAEISLGMQFCTQCGENLKKGE